MGWLPRRCFAESWTRTYPPGVSMALTEKQREYQRRYYADRKEAKSAAYRKRYAEDSCFRDNILSRQRVQYAKDDATRERKERYRRDPATRSRNRARSAASRKKRDDAYLAVILRSRLYFALKKARGVRTVSAVRDLGCSIARFRAWLEGLFLPGMSWENFGSAWHVDHIVPFRLVRPLDAERQRKLCHFTNLRPLWAKANRERNGNKALMVELRSLGLVGPGNRLRFPCDLADERNLA